MGNIKHSISGIRGLRPSISHYFLMNLENFVDDNNLCYFKEMKTLYKFKDSDQVKKNFKKYGRLISTPLGSYVETNNTLILLSTSVNDSGGLYLHIEFFYNSDVKIEELEKRILKDQNSFECKEVITRIDWQFKGNEGLDSMSIFEINNVEIHDEAYPYINGGIDQYIKEFLDSDETILIMIGPAGTGKTKLIKYIMRYMALKLEKKTSQEEVIRDDYYENGRTSETFVVSYSSSQEAYNDDEFFIDFIRGNSELLILEDIDYNLRSRSDGNTFMHKLLNASDGIVELKKKKIIITTNLESEQKTDSALLRPGRTFDVLKTKYLNLEQAQNLAVKLKTPFDIEKQENKFSLAEIYKNRIETTHQMSFR
jgi:hypothetical protein